MSRRPAQLYEELARFDSELLSSRGGPLAGVDEAGRGALAGPVVAAAVICGPDESLCRVRDSKLLSEPVREELFAAITARSLAWAVGVVQPGEIDSINILNATMKAMRAAVRSLSLLPRVVVVDGLHAPGCGFEELPVKGGDNRSFSVAAASIVAKVTRDRMMRESDGRYPGYKFSRNKGYGTREHIEAIRALGRCGIHRKTFRVDGGSEEDRGWTGGSRRVAEERG